MVDECPSNSDLAFVQGISILRPLNFCLLFYRLRTTNARNQQQYVNFCMNNWPQEPKVRST